MLRELAPELATARPASCKATRLPALKLVDHHRRGQLHPACCASPMLLATAGARRARQPRPQLGDGCSSTTRSTSSSPAAPPASPRARRCPTTTSSTTAISSPRRCSCTADDRLCIPVPLYHCFGMVMGNLGCVTHGATMVYPGRGLRPAGGAETVAGRALHRRSTACRPCSSPSSTIRDFAEFDLSTPAHRHHGRLALPDRGDEAGGRRSMHMPR